MVFPNLTQRIRLRAPLIIYQPFRPSLAWKRRTNSIDMEFSAVPFRMEKEKYICRYSTISQRDFWKNYIVTCHKTEI